MNNDEYLVVKACQQLLNELPRRHMTHHIYKDSYQLATAVDKILTNHEYKMTQYVEDADCEPVDEVSREIEKQSILDNTTPFSHLKTN